MRNEGKQVAIIQNLPDNPTKPMVWIVYNSDMIKQVEDLIRDLKGDNYLEYIKVVSRFDGSKYPGRVYFDPFLLDHIGNGAS